MKIGKMVSIKRVRAKRGFKHDLFIVSSGIAYSPSEGKEPKMRELCTLTYNHSTMEFKLADKLSSVTEYRRDKINSVISTREFINALLKFKYSKQIEVVTVYLSSMPVTLVSDIEDAWREY